MADETNDPYVEESDVQATEIRDIVYSCILDHEGATAKIIGRFVPESPLPPIIIVHDIGESCERYRDIAEQIAAVGFSTYGYNLRGHKPNSKKLDRLASFHQLGKDLLQVVAMIHHKEHKPPVILGRGMGALIALSLTKTHGRFASGLILSSPMFELNYNVTPFRRFCISSLAEMAPTVKLPGWLMPPIVAPSQKIARETGHKGHWRLGSAFTFELLNSLSQSKKTLGRLNIPSLFLYPEKDPNLRYKPLKSILQKNENSNKFSIRQLGGDDDPEGEAKSSADRYLTHAVITWLQDSFYPDVGVEDEASDHGEDSN